MLHRDIKPPNILINEDNRPVLIDFGSARFDTAEATSTKVTFHTPPYAAIEQYVKTYPQGPWTDVYALGVVMYECVTGEKPAEVLERLHAGLGKPLAEGKWPGYGKKFLQAMDAAMVVKPDERPQSMSEWLAMFGKPDVAIDTPDDEATRFYAKQVETEEIKPVPPTPNVDPKAPVETGVPADPKEAKFKRAGQETGAGKKAKTEEEAADASAKGNDAKPAKAAAATAAVAAAAPPAKTGKTGEPAVARKKPSPAVMAGVAAVALAVVGIGAYTMRGGSGPDTAVTDNLGTSASNDAGTMAALGTSETVNADAAVNGTANATVPEAAPNAALPTNSGDELRAEKAKAAAAQAQLAAMKKAQAKTAAAQAVQPPGLQGAPKGKAKAGAANEFPTQAADFGGVSPAKLSQFYSIVDDARGMAKRVMRSSNSQNASLARSYDANLKTLRDLIRGVNSDKDADRLIKQANQTRAYVQYLYRQ